MKQSEPSQRAAPSQEQVEAIEPLATLKSDAELHFAAGRMEQALACYEAAIALAPASPSLPYNAANVLRILGRTSDAVTLYDKAIGIRPHFAQAHHNKAAALLQLGSWREGFAEHEWRKFCPTYEEYPYDLPRPWHGEDPRGKTIYIFPEMYQGDLIQFSRYALLIEKLGGRVILGAPAEMHALLRTLSPDVRLVGPGEHPSGYDYQCGLMSLPLLFGTTPDRAPNGPHYLRAEPARVAKWRDRIGESGRRIGIVWHGSVRAAERSFPLALAADILAGLPGMRLISLQKHSGLDQLVPSVETLGADFDPGPHAFLDTAAAMMSCDLIVSADTSAAHLAGALGVETWLALPRPADWRWLEERADTPWYPNMRLFRQPVRGDWRGVFQDMATVLGIPGFPR